MALSDVEIEKQFYSDEHDTFIRLILYDDHRCVLDITHHNTEADADAYLLRQWRVSDPPCCGQRRNYRISLSS
jgi:hypothetical protein